MPGGGSYTPFQRSGSVEVTEDKVGFLGRDPQVNFRVRPGDVIRARVVVSTSGNIKTRLTVFPSKGEGPIYDKGVVTQWVRGKTIPLSLEYQVPQGMEWVKVALDQPNWTPEQVPSGESYPDFPDAQMTGTVSWKNAIITKNEPLTTDATIAGFPARQVVMFGGLAIGVGVLAVVAT